MKLLIIVESLSGNSLTFVERITMEYINWDISVVAPSEFKEDLLSIPWNKVMIGCYTWGNGKIPKQTKKFAIEYRDWLMAQDLLVFGSGWTIYQNFCGAVDGLGIILDCQNKIKFELMYDQDVEIEAEQTLKSYLY